MTSFQVAGRSYGSALGRADVELRERASARRRDAGDDAEPEGGGTFSKVLMYAALQHFPKAFLGPLLDDILAMTTDDPVILIGFVPEQRRRFAFYDSWPRRLTYLSRKLVGKDVMGSWWSRADFETACAARGLECSFHPIAEGLKAHDYRFDAVIRKRG